MSAFAVAVSITRHDADGTVIQGTAWADDVDGTGRVTVTDFRDLDGNELSLPPGSSFMVPVGALSPSPQGG